MSYEPNLAPETSDYGQALQCLHEMAVRGDAERLAGEDPSSIFCLGWCDMFATALAGAHPGWQVLAWGESKCDAPDDCAAYDDLDSSDPAHLCGCATRHFYVHDPATNTYWDINGEHDPVGVDEIDPDRIVRPVTDSQLTCVLESWHLSGEDESDFAALALACAFEMEPVVEFHLDLYAISRRDEHDPERRIEWRVDLETSGDRGQVVFDQASGEWRNPSGLDEEAFMRTLLAALRARLGVDY